MQTSTHHGLHSMLLHGGGLVNPRGGAELNCRLAGRVTWSKRQPGPKGPRGPHLRARLSGPTSRYHWPHLPRRLVWEHWRRVLPPNLQGCLLGAARLQPMAHPAPCCWAALDAGGRVGQAVAEGLRMPLAVARLDRLPAQRRRSAGAVAAAQPLVVPGRSRGGGRAVAAARQRPAAGKLGEVTEAALQPLALGSHATLPVRAAWEAGLVGRGLQAAAAVGTACRGAPAVGKQDELTLQMRVWLARVAGMRGCPTITSSADVQTLSRPHLGHLCRHGKPGALPRNHALHACCRSARRWQARPCTGHRWEKQVVAGSRQHAE